LPLGMFSTSRYTVERIKFERGDSLLLYTDGLSEAMDASGTEYGTERLSNLVRERHGCAPQDLATACMKEVTAHRGAGKQLDDQTLMVVHRGSFASSSAND
jgi:sigma-B regulation protein RsbU (phosphoserine phosphatase)